MGRYERQLPLLGEEGQERLGRARIGVAGCGGLGTNVLTALASAGAGSLTIADGDVPADSNLNRQYVYRSGQTRKKAHIMEEWISSLNPGVSVSAFPERVTGDNAGEVFGGCDFLVDCLDSVSGRKMLNGYALSSGKTLVHAGVSGFHGQVTVVAPGRTPCLECLLKMGDPASPPPSIGAAVAFIGAAEAAEAIKIAAGLGSPLEGRLFTADLLSGSFEVTEVRRDEACPACGAQARRA
ncbi:MAG: HesA/MoeB/ThiF family protein [Candidatus Methanoplasma sp.]|jgi:molybdopterin/thiamine biosynthesis adenylyltransferase|nr:HesA/MoeB/ThiF family protein [Candidatus Methanoplasma sp.]